MHSSEQCLLATLLPLKICISVEISQKPEMAFVSSEEARVADQLFYIQVNWHMSKTDRWETEMSTKLNR